MTDTHSYSVTATEEILALADRIAGLPTYSGTDLGMKHYEVGQPPETGSWEDRVFLVHEKWRDAITQALRAVVQGESAS